MLPMLAAHPRRVFCTKYPRGNLVIYLHAVHFLHNPWGVFGHVRAVFNLLPMRCPITVEIKTKELIKIYRSMASQGIYTFRK